MKGLNGGMELQVSTTYCLPPYLRTRHWFGSKAWSTFCRLMIGSVRKLSIPSDSPVVFSFITSTGIRYFIVLFLSLLHSVICKTLTPRLQGHAILCLTSTKWICCTASLYARRKFLTSATTAESWIPQKSSSSFLRVFVFFVCLFHCLSLLFFLPNKQLNEIWWLFCHEGKLFVRRQLNGCFDKRKRRVVKKSTNSVSKGLQNLCWLRQGAQFIHGWFTEGLAR